MAMLSLICCLLALSSSAFARSHYGGYSSVPSTPMILPTAARELPIEQKPLTLPTQYGGYGQQQPTVVRDLPLEQKPVTLPTQYGGYGQQQPETFIQKTLSLPVQQVIPSPQQLLLQQQQELLAKNEAAKIITEADILCRGQLPETVLPLHHGHRFVVCLEDGKGWEQHCPKGLLWHPETRRCERKLGPLESPCASQPCLNGGKCVQTDVSSYRCECPTGLDGTICELDARVCHTQQPCGQAPGTRCQSFRFGAALQYVCIHQHGHAYGFNAQQIQGNPCQGIDGARSLLISDKGFIMCDGERMAIESCPGGTLWDDNNKACVWPDMQEFVTLPVVEKKSFDLQRPLPTSSYSYGQPQTPFIEKPKVFTRVIPQQVQEYGAQVQPMKHFESRELPSQQIEFPKQQSYGQQSYGQQPQTPFIETPKILPRVFPQQVQEYGAQVQPMKHFESRELPSQQIEVPKQQSYGQQPVPQTWTQPIVPRFRELRPLPVQSGY